MLFSWGPLPILGLSLLRASPQNPCSLPVPLMANHKMGPPILSEENAETGTPWMKRERED